MLKSISSVLAATLAIAASAPVMADNSLKGAMMAPVKVVAFTSGAVVGTPIAMLRKSCANITSMSGEISNKSTNPGVRLTSAAVVLPFAMLKGGVEGSVMGTENSWKNMNEKPLSGDRFSLGDMKSE